MIRVLVIIPCFNEEASVEDVIDGVRKFLPDAQLLVIDDGSTDDTYQKALAAGAKVLRHPINLGIGVTVQTGYKYALRNGYDIVVQVDGDGQHLPVFLPELITPLTHGQADMVIGSRYFQSSRLKGRVSSIGRVIGSSFLTTMIHLLSGKNLFDSTSGFRAVGKPLIKAFAENYPYDYPEPVSALWAISRGYAVAEIPVQMAPRVTGRSSISPVHSVIYILKVTWTMCLNRIYR